MNNIILILCLLVGCVNPDDERYDGPHWGDPCTPKEDDPAVLYACQHPDPDDPKHIFAGVCEPDGLTPLGGSCRHFCNRSVPGLCAPGSTPTPESHGVCYCALDD